MNFDLTQVYEPSERQRVFHSCPADFILYGGAAGGGKSEALLWEAFLSCLEIPGNRALLIRRKFPELNRSLIQRSLAKFPATTGLCRYVASEKSWYFANNSVLEFGYCERESDVYNYQSAEYGFIGFDELTHFTQTQWDYLVNSRLRSVVPGAWPRARGASNPGNVGHAWVKAMFGIGSRKPDYVYTLPEGLKIAFIPAKVTDNPYIVKYDPDYIKRLDRLDPKWRKALKDGDWDVFAGQFFTGWDESIHVVEHFEPPRKWHRFHALDWGYAKPYSIGWYAVKPDGTLYRYRELYGWGGEANKGSREDAEEVARRVATIEAEADEKDLLGPADPACWTSTGHTGPTISETFAQYGVNFVRADNNRPNGWDQCRNRLKPQEHNEQPRFIVSDKCPHFIRTIPTQTHSEKRPEDLDTDGEDHIADEWRYAMMYWRGPTEEPRAPRFEDDLRNHFRILANAEGQLIYIPKDDQQDTTEWWEA